MKKIEYGTYNGPFGEKVESISAGVQIKKITKEASLDLGLYSKLADKQEQTF